MQNEITELRNQVRTLKRIVCLMCCLFASTMFAGCEGTIFEETICKEGQERNGLVYLPNQQEPFTGKKLCKYENGQNRVEGKYKDGLLDGIWTEWYENGQIEAEENYKDGKQDGKWTVWYMNGQKYREINYKDGVLID